MISSVSRLALGACCLAALLGLSACASDSETVSRDNLTAHVGVYDPPPPGQSRARLGVPPFDTSGADFAKNMENVAADQASSLMLNTDRFTVIERTQLQQLLKEQGLEGVVRPEEMAKSGQVRGVDYLLIGKVTNFRVKKIETSKGFGIGRIRAPIIGSTGVFDIKDKKQKIKVEVGVDLRLVDPTSGEVSAAHFGEYTREDKVSAFGVEILGAGASADANLEIDESNQGKLLRLALDETIRKMLPRIDRTLQERAQAGGG